MINKKIIFLDIRGIWEEILGMYGKWMGKRKIKNFEYISGFELGDNRFLIRGRGKVFLKYGED